MMKSSILSRKIIKPLIPTHSSLRRHNLSFLDYTNIPQYIPIVAFYSKPPKYDIINQIFENSLSKVLSSYYPFAGKIMDYKHVDCNDTGAEYLNVRINCQMSEVLNNPYNDVVDVLFPQGLPWSRSLNGHPLIVQLSHFDCGGLAISVCLSHKIADAYSLSKFLDDWASIARDDPLDFKPSPQFDAASFFPLMDDPPTIPDVVPEQQQRVSRIFHFSSSNLDKLKADVVATNSGVVQNPTRIEVATALIHKCGVSISMEKYGLFKPTLLSHLINLRPPIPLNTIGNAACHFGSITMKEDEIKLPNFVAQLQKAKQQLRDKLKNMNTYEVASHALEKIKEGMELIGSNIFDIFYCSSICNLGLHKIDFGFGSPVRVTLAKNPLMKKHFFFLDDPSGDGINVLITLPQDDMDIFQSNKELLEFASPLGQYL